MNEDHLNIEIRKFLKKIGIKSQRLIEQEIRDAFNKGQINIGSEIDLEMQLTMKTQKLSKLDVTHKIADRILIE